MSTKERDGFSVRQREMLKQIESHRQAELERFNVDQTLATMAATPYLFYVATAGGGKGQRGVRHFYSRLVRQIPKDTQWVLISRTVDTHRVVLEAILKFTHDVRMDWILPGVEPTRKSIHIPLVIIFSFEGKKIKSERIYWDQASALVQLGVLRRQGLPIVGDESPKKLLSLVRTKQKK